MLHIKVITPTKKILDSKALSITLPSSEGEITILPKHTSLFSMLVSGIVTVRLEHNKEEDFAIEKGYVETDGKTVTVLVSKAYGESDIDAQKVEEAIAQAQKDIQEASGKDKTEAMNTLRRSTLDLKLLKKRKSK